MVSEVTDGIEVSVKSKFEIEFSRPDESHFVFSYDITITNDSDDTVQLLRRKWYTVDSTGETNTVEGEGVVGQQPTLLRGESHNYQSGMYFNSPMGKMNGSYIFRKLSSGEEFEVNIPEFHLIAPFVLN